MREQVPRREPRGPVLVREPEIEVRAERRVFEGLAAGRLNAVTALLRGELVAEGDPRLLVRLQRLFPGPRSSRRISGAGRRWPALVASSAARGCGRVALLAAER